MTNAIKACLSRFGLGGLLREPGEYPEVVGENAPGAEAGFVFVAPFAGGVAEEAVHDDCDAGFGLGASDLVVSKFASSNARTW